MKKLFFSALVAMVAVGAAFATNSKKVVATGEFYSDEQLGQPDIICNSGPQLCSAFYSVPAWTGPADDEDRDPVNLADYEHPVD